MKLIFSLYSDLKKHFRLQNSPGHWSSFVRIMYSAVIFLFVSLTAQGCNEKKNEFPVWAYLFGLSSDTNAGSNNNPDVGPAVQDALIALGVNTDIGGRVDKDGNPYPDNFNPLWQKNVTKFSVHEIVALTSGTDATDSTHPRGIYENLSGVDYGVHYLEAVHEFPDAVSYVMNTVKSGTAGDLDGDGFDEVAIAYIKSDGDIMLNVTDDKSGTYKSLANGIKVGTTAYFSNDGSSLTPGDMDMSAGDIDGDGKDELIIAVGVRVYQKVDGDSVITWASPGIGKIIVLDDASTGFKELATQTYTNSYAPRVTTGDTNGDMKSEIAVSISIGSEANYYIYKYENSKLTQLNGSTSIDHVAGTVHHRPFMADVTSGDLNGNGTPEFIFAGVEKPVTDTYYVFQSVEFNGTDFTVTGTGIDDDIHASDINNGKDYYCVDTATWCSYQYVKVLDVFAETLDVDGDGKLELLANNWVRDQNFGRKKDPQGLQMWIWDLMNNRNDFESSSINSVPFMAFHRANTWIAVGDFTGDQRDDIAYWGRNRWGDITIAGVDGTGNWISFDGGSDEKWALAYFSTVQVAGGDYQYPVLLAANTDDDSMIVQFDRSEIVFTEPIPLAAIAAAPCYGSNVEWQNIGDGCNSSYGDGKTIGSASENSMTVSAAVMGGFDVGDEATLEVEMIVTAEMHVGWSDGKEHSVTKSIAYTSGPNEDIVVFSSVPYDAYYYKVISSPKPEVPVGSELLIRVPRKPIVMQAERGYYNNAVKKMNPNRVIETETFNHTPGNPWSYPGRAAAENLLSHPVYGNIGWITDGIGVGQGSGSTTATIDVSDATSRSISAGIDLSVDLMFTASGLKLGGKVGFGTDMDITMSETNFSTYSGSVGAIATDQFTDNRYSFGLFAYPNVYHPSGFQFHTVNFWVE